MASLDIASLNPPQRQAVNHTFGPLLVLAGAGSGKTRVVTTRIARLLREGYEGRCILALTFTNKAAREMKERVFELVGRRAARGTTISTFHSLCARILRKDAHRIDVNPAFTILDTSDQLAQLLRVARDHQIDLGDVKPQRILSRIGSFKNDGLHPQDVPAGSDPEHILGRRLYGPLSRHLRQLSAVDFDDLLLLARDLLRDVRDVRERYRALFRFMLIDEYQDTNPLQFELVKLLVGQDNNICAVGDDDQAIYGFRGGCIDNILNFDTHFPGCEVVKLEQNYRSTSTILDAANAVIANNTLRRDKVLFSEMGTGEPITLLSLDNGELESAAVAKRITEWLKVERFRPRDIAVLYRANPQSRSVEEALRLAEIPYEVVGGQEFYERKEVKDTLAYLTLMAHPGDELSFRRVVNLPARGLGSTSVARVLASAREAKETLVAFGERGAPGAGLKASQAAALIGFCRPIKQAREELSKSTPWDDLTEICGRAIENAGLRAAMDAEKELARRERISESMEEVLRAFAVWCDRLVDARENPDLAESWLIDATAAPLTSFLDRVSLDEDEKEKRKQKDRLEKSDPVDETTPGKVTLMTLHRSKGLEYPAVFMVGFEEGLLPHRRVLEAGESVEEERRLCYVGITRAKRVLTMTLAKARRRRKTLVPRTISRFAAEIPAALLAPEEKPVELSPEDYFAQMRARFGH